MSGVVVGVLSSSPTASASGLTWSIVPSPNTSQTQDNELTAVSCSGPSACIAVGFYYTPETRGGTAYQTLIESWNGSVWSIVPSPNTSPTQDNLLKGVSCSGPSTCVAVGSQSNASAEQTLIESWNGSAWSIVPSPNGSPTQDNVLNAVSCTGPSACVAVGSYYTGSADQTLIESWNGSAWSIVTSPNTSPTQANDLGGVSCSGPSACVAVGEYYLSGTFSKTLTESWTGSAWSIVPSPNTSPTQINQLRGVSCASPSACTAFGFYEPSSGFDQTLIESWNGSAWSIVPSPNISPTQNNELTGVSCTSPSDCTAVGYYISASSDGLGSDQTLIESWNGSVWSIVASPNASQTNVLFGVSCNSSTNCVAVGYDETSSNPMTQNTLIETTGPTTSIIIPSNGATLTGSTYIDAGATNATSVKFLLFGGIYGYAAPVVCTATATYYGWLCSWNTTTVPNGSYGLVSEASGPGGTAYSSGVGITVNNPPPTTSILVPSNGASLSGTAATLDAGTSNATSVEFLLFGGSYGYAAPVICTATLSYYGWVCSWNTTTVPDGSYVLLSEAFNSVGNAFSIGVGINVDN